MKKIALVGYRDWAIKIYDNIISSFPENSYLKIYSEKDYNKEKLFSFNPDFILFYGWSKIISDDVISSYTSLILHPSELPKYRGGSPIQNQIIRGEKKSAVTIFIADSGIDTGDIIGQKPIELTGEIPEIFDRMTKVGTEITKDFFLGKFARIKQKSSESSYYKRRLPWQSEITLQEIESQSGEYIYNKIRMLTGPYPRAYIKTSDGKKIIINSAELAD